MPKKTQHEIPTEDEIMRQNNVPVEMAARYIGWSTPTLYYALQDQRAPFGVAVKSPKGGWAYNISPGLLVKYKRGDLPTYRLQEVIDLAAEGVQRVLQEQASGLNYILRVVGACDGGVALPLKGAVQK